MTTPRRRTLKIGGTRIRRSETVDLRLPVSETYTAEPVTLPVRVIRGQRPGPTVLVTAAVHGDEINGVGIIREFMFDPPPQVRAGALICVPVLNIFGFETQQRYMPDGRDLNRHFPGSPGGSLASRFADQIMTELVARADVLIDLHSAGETRTNYPNVRADMSDPEVARLATAFGCEIIIDGQGPDGSLRREAGRLGKPTIILEAGEVNKIEPGVLDIGLRGLQNALVELGLLRGPILKPGFQAVVRKTTWIRSSLGGILRFHVSPGDIVSGGQPIATNASVFGDARSVLISPVDGIVLGMTTHPAVKPGEPVCHIALTDTPIDVIRDARRGDIDRRVHEDIATSISIHPT